MLFVKNTGIKDFLLISLFFLSGSVLMANTYYVAPPTATPAGNDRNPGTINAPWATWGKAVWTAQAGDTVYFRGGVYYVTSTIRCDPLYGNGNNGTETDPICYFNYPNEKPILDGINKTSPSSGLQFHYTSHIHIKGLTVRNNFQITQDYLYAMNFYFFRCTNITVENCVAYNSGRRGFYVYLCDDILLLNCDSYNNYDPLVTGYPGGGGDGFLVWDNGTAEFADATITLKNCRAWNNSDDGFDVEIEGLIVMENCWSFNNGYDDGDGVGIKIGLTSYKTTDVKRKIYNCISAYNLETGLNTNDRNCVAKNMEIYNNISYRNGYKGVTTPVYGYYICNTSSSDEQELTRIFRNNIAFDNEGGPIGVARYALYTHDHNSWDIPITLTDNDFVSLDSTGISGPRKPDGSLPDLNGFLKLKAGSKAIDTGVDVGLPYFGKAPDLGAYEYDPEEGMNQYPVISITSPEPGDVFTTPVNITIITDASDPDGSVKIVEFYNGSVKIGEKTSAPWSFTWSNVPEGTYNISAVATDDLNAKTPSAPVKVTVNQPPPVINQPPSVSITNPVNGSVFTAPATITISADATDADGLVSKVEFFNGTSKLGERTSKPWTYTWNNVAPGNYTITAVATDNASAKTTSTIVTITVNAYPEVSITSPVSGSNFTAPANITIAAKASDSDGSIASVEFFNGENSLSVLTSAPWSFSWSDVPEGTYTITAAATDNNNAKTISAPVTITVNQPPYVSIINPVNGSVFTAPATISISADATDTDGLVSKVEFFNGTTKLGERTSKPWTYTWNNVAHGYYTITAVATDNASAKTTSEAVTFRVNAYPEISISSPLSGSSFTSPAHITIAAKASDSDGTIDNVEFYNGNNSLSVITSAPWETTWNNVSPGNYALRAVATDNSGLKTESGIVYITVNEASRSINEPPSVSIVHPVNGSVFTAPATILISADATDADGLVSKVEFFNGTAKLVERTSEPWTYTWNNVAPGNYTITAVATDNASAKNTSAAITVRVNAYPEISISSPLSGSSFTSPANITIAAQASDRDGTIDNVEFFNGNNSLSVITSAPWETAWNNVSPGNYGIRAVATDNSGLKTESGIVYITVKEAPPVNQPPIVYISKIESESLYAPTNIIITAEASDADGSVTSVEFFNGSKSLGLKSAPPWIMEWGDVPAGTYYLSATATDNLGSKTKSPPYSLTINELSNQAPVVSIVSPVDRQVFEKNDEIMITIAASDPDGSIERIELYDGSELFAKISSSPYTYPWKYAGEGFHIISAVAVDNLNESTISSPVSIEVKAGQNESEENENRLDLYPNPNDGNFTVAFTGADPDGLGMIDIISVEGKSIIREILGSENITKTFELSRIKSGVYILIYRNKGQIIGTKKFIKN